MISVLVPAAMGLIDKLFPDANAANAAKLRVLEMQQAGELAALEADMTLAQGQLAVNKSEAQSANQFVSGWRPFIGWVCGMVFAVNFLVIPLVATYTAVMGDPINVEPLDMTVMMPVLLGMLGLGGFRTYEKLNGVNQRH